MSNAKQSNALKTFSNDEDGSEWDDFDLYSNDEDGSECDDFDLDTYDEDDDDEPGSIASGNWQGSLIQQYLREVAANAPVLYKSSSQMQGPTVAQTSKYSPPERWSLVESAVAKSTGARMTIYRPNEQPTVEIAVYNRGRAVSSATWYRFQNLLSHVDFDNPVWCLSRSQIVQSREILGVGTFGDNQFSRESAGCPVYCRVTGATISTLGGWPMLIVDGSMLDSNRSTLKYFKRVYLPGTQSGSIDECCFSAPASMFPLYLIYFKKSLLSLVS